MRVDDRVPPGWFRMPYWFTAKPTTLNILIDVTDDVSNNWVFDTSIVEMTEYTPFDVYREFIRGLGASSIKKTGICAFFKHVALLSIVGTLARQYYFPKSSQTCYIYVQGSKAWSGFDMVGLPVDLQDFLTSALYLDNPFNAFEAGVAWIAAPWEQYPTNFIRYRRDDDLVRLHNISS